RLREAAQHVQLAALDVDLDECRNAVGVDEDVEGGDLDIDRRVPRHAAEARLAAARFAPVVLDRRHGGRALADEQFRVSRLARQRALYHLYLLQAPRQAA